MRTVRRGVAASPPCAAPPPHPLPCSFEAWQRREAKAHPLYERSSDVYGKVPAGEEPVLQKPAHAKPPSGGLSAVTKERRTTLNTTMAKSRYF